MNTISPPTACINAVFEAWAVRQPDQRLFAFLDSRGSVVEDLTYRDFQRRVDTLAVELAARTMLRVGDRVLLAYQPGLEIIAALFACAKVGLIAIPTAPLSPFDFEAWARRLDHILGDSAPTAWLTCGRTLKLLEENQRRQIDAEARAATARLDALLVIESPAIATNPSAQAPNRPHPIVFLQYTSGSTSKPKGVCVSHENLIANCQAVVDHERPVAVTWLPQHHDMGLIGYYLYVALSGGTTWGMSPRSFIQNPAIWLKLLTRCRATATSVPNFALELCLNDRRVPATDLDGYDLSNLRFFMVAAEPVEPETFETFRRRFARSRLKCEAIYVAFGLAEFTLAVSSYGRRVLSVDRRHLAKGRVILVSGTSGVSHALRLISCGRALGDADIRIVDPNTGIEMEPGRTGEVWVAGSGRASGYWRKPAASRATFEARLESFPHVRTSFLRTGDIGFMHEGELFICGRLKDMIIVRGQNIYPEDIESLARQVSPEIRRKGVVAFASADGHETNITLVAEVARGCNMPDGKAIVRAIREGLNVPVARVVFVPPRSVARTSSGKLRRAHTRQLFETGELQVLVDTRHAVSGLDNSGDTDVYELELLKNRYRLTGEEEFTLFDAGIDSLDLLVFLNWIKDSLIERGAPELAERVEPRLLDSISIRDLFAIARQFDTAPEAATRLMSEFFAHAFEARLTAEHKKMQADRVYEVVDRRTPARSGQSLGALVTGATGFLGPFLIAALLGQTDDDLRVLVRGRSRAEARARLDKAYIEAIDDAVRLEAYKRRVQVMLGDLELPHLGLDPPDWKRLADGIDTVWHNGALVNYLLSYDHMRAANVEGTANVLDLCFEGREKLLNYVSTTFIFGWSAKALLYETDRNEGMDKLDFGYSQSKWVAEQRVLSAMDQGLKARVFRPALITPALSGRGGNLDITIRLLSFMVKHGLGVTARNQVSFMPADITADNIVAIARQEETLGQTFHVVRDALETMEMITDLISEKQGTRFEMYNLPDFVPQVIKRCTRADPLYPLLDFLVSSVDNISSMEFKRYESGAYQAARNRSPEGRADPPLETVVAGILAFLKLRNLV